MKLVFVYWGYENAGSMLDLRGYARAACEMGHEVTVYGPPNPKFALDYSQYLADADAVVFVFEWTTALQFGDWLDWTRLLEAVPRRRRVVIDCDGAYNDPIEFHGDYNHRTIESSCYWTDVCDSLSDKIFQPTFRPRRKNVRPFLFHIYDPTWETPLDFADKEFDMIYVGHTKFRWRGMSQVLRAIERVRDRVGRVALVGEGWERPMDYMEWDDIKANYYVDREYLKKVRAEVLPAVPYHRVTETINKGVFNPVVYRPLFEQLGMVTCRTFETPAAGTIPLFLLDRTYVTELFGERAIELVLDGEHAHEKIVDVLERPEQYAEIVMGIRKDFGRLHSPQARLRELVEFIEE
jgi:glycosyltransferase involved in cell wall biosynthesis